MTSIWLWIGTVGMALGAAYFATLIPRANEKSRHFYFITFAIALTATIAYLTMATGKGQQLIGNDSGGGYRVFYYARYIDWTITTPLLLLDLALLGLTRPLRQLGLIITLIVLDLIMIEFGLIGGAAQGVGKYVWWAVATVAMIALLYLLVTRVLPQARAQGQAVGNLYSTISTLTIVLWSIYPIVFFLGTEGLAIVGIDWEVLLYMVLDLSAKIGFGFLLLSNRRALEATSSATPERSRGVA